MRPCDMWGDSVLRASGQLPDQFLGAFEVGHGDIVMTHRLPDSAEREERLVAQHPRIGVGAWRLAGLDCAGHPRTLLPQPPRLCAISRGLRP
jgi:hypothetical protein